MTETKASLPVRWDLDNAGEAWERGLQKLFALLEQRPGWRRGQGGWDFVPSMPPGASGERGSVTPCEATAIDDDGSVYPPSVRYYYDEDDSEPALRTAAEITGIAHPPLSGEVKSVTFDSTDEIVAALDEIESWRWPARLPDRDFNAGRGVSWEPGLPSDIDELSAVLAGRPGWRREEEAHDGLSLAQLWPAWTYLPTSPEGTTIRPDQFDGVGYRVWAPVGSYRHLHFFGAASLTLVLTQIESWRRDHRPRWIDRATSRTAAACPRCGVEAGQECHSGGGFGYVIHSDRLAADAIAVTASVAAPRPGQRPQGRPRRKTRKR
ncbi:hypothetical protein ACLQ25_21645 [Micromonospora sp. DT44]|uniref:hypothetical protein n=1 Tax=Micromonospora sp. DT44 TaxID=3393439 RepID=UPI003CEBF571